MLVKIRWDSFLLAHELTCGKRGSVSLATLDEKSTRLLNPMREKIERKDRGEEGTTPTACPEAGK